jgi:RHS repeat-associated protein
MVAVNNELMHNAEKIRRRTRPLVNNLYQGMTLDAATGLYDERNCDYSPSLGRWMEQDPAQFINGANTYQFVNSSPVGNVDAEGLAGATVTGSAVPAPPSTPGTSPAKPPGSGTVGAGATTGSVPTGLPGTDIKVGAGGTVSTGGTVTGQITGAVTKNLGNGTTATVKVTGEAKDNLTKNPNKPIVNVGVKCTIARPLNTGFGRFEGSLEAMGIYGPGGPAAVGGSAAVSAESHGWRLGLTGGYNTQTGLSGFIRLSTTW